MAIVTADLFPHSGSPDLSIDTKNEGTALRYHRKVWPASSRGAVLANNKAVVEERDQGGDGRAQHKMYMNGRKKHARARRRKGEKERKDTHTEASAHGYAHAERVHHFRRNAHSLTFCLCIHTHAHEEEQSESLAPKGRPHQGQHSALHTPRRIAART